MILSTMAAPDWSRLFSAIPAAATAIALATALAPLAGSQPMVTNNGGYYSITFTDAQKEHLTAWILSQLNKEPGPVRVDLNQIALQVIARKYWPYMLGLVLAGAAAAYYLGKAR